MNDVYRAISDTTRRQILDVLVERDGLPLFEICARLAARNTTLTRQAISQHLAVLEDAGLVRSGRVGRTKVHHLDRSPSRQITERWQVG